MNCFYHPIRAAVATCVVCNKGLCHSCVQTEKDVDAYSAGSYCPSCASGVRRRVESHNIGALIFGVVAGNLLLYVASLLFGWSSTETIIIWGLAEVLFLASIFTWAIVKQRKLQCPVCGTKAPIARAPKNIDQALRGGWTCSTCGADMDRNGHLKGI